MGTEQDARRQFGTKTRDDVRCVENGAVVALEVGLLRRDNTAVLLEFLDDPVFATLVTVGVHRPRAEIALRLTKSIGGIG